MYLRGSSPFDFFVRENAKGKMKNKISKLFLNYSDIGELFLSAVEFFGGSNPLDLLCELVTFLYESKS